MTKNGINDRKIIGGHNVKEHTEKNFSIEPGNPYPLGVRKVGEKTQFTVAVKNGKKLKIHLYKKDNQEEKITIELTEKYRIGDIFSVLVDKLVMENYEYLFEVDGKEFIDPYAKIIVGRKQFGKLVRQSRKIKGAVVLENFDWEGDKPIGLSYTDMILYRLHIRGFTKHISSQVEHRGTFLGLEEKINYLLELGINAIEFMPIYEFNEILKEETYGIGDSRFTPYPEEKKSEKTSYRVNYWGYSKECNYFAPKTSYAADSKNPVFELKHMIKTLHQNGIEAIMEICFAEGSNQYLIMDCLRYWVLEYHIDGFRINDNIVPVDIIAADPMFSHIKLFTTSWNLKKIYSDSFIPDYCNLAEYNDGFLVDIRRYLKGDEGQVNSFLYRFKYNPARKAVINYITNTNGFTLMDLVSYDIKHNEANGEQGHDGTEFNYSWNCGIEGKTRRKSVLALRKKQVKNALLMLFLSQGTPLLLSGDEFGNSQNGNNNAYCQDNYVSWLNWGNLNTNKEIYQFTRKLISIRKSHKIFHMPNEFRMADYISCGYPDISFHGTKSWYPDFSNYSRVLGVMLCGKYAKIDRKTEDKYFYLAFNMHWEVHRYELPKLPSNMEWKLFINSSETIEQEMDSDAKEEVTLDNQRIYEVKPRSIVIFIGKEKLKQKKKLREKSIEKK